MNDRLKWILLGIFLIITGLGLLGIGLGGILSVIAGVCALIAGILFIINRWSQYPSQARSPNWRLCLC
jgi:hypothetical protein